MLDTTVNSQVDLIYNTQSFEKKNESGSLHMRNISWVHHSVPVYYTPARQSFQTELKKKKITDWIIIMCLYPTLKKVCLSVM